MAGRRRRSEVETMWGPVPAPRRVRRTTRPKGAASAGGVVLTQAAARKARAKKRRAQRAPGQLSLGEVVTHGGRRAGAGRKRGLRPNVPHRPRERHREYQPAHVTLRRAKGVPGLRSQRLERVVREAMRATTKARDGAFRVTDYSIQNDHIHLIVEADELGDNGEPVGPWFEGFMQVLERPPGPSPVERARTWLLDWGWHHGRDFIHLGELPAAVRRP